MRFAKEVWPFLLPPLVPAFILALVGWLLPAMGLALLGLFVLYFFRDPQRVFEGPDELVLAPADGVITLIDTVEDREIGPGRRRRVATFLSAFNVHVQRAPTEGEVIHTCFRDGRKVAAFRAHADQVNQQQLTVLRRTGGDLIGVRQVAGLLARRVVAYLSTGDRVARGHRLGIIKFGSRVDLIVPADYDILVQEGDRMIAGETPVAKSTDPSSSTSADSA